MFTRPHDKITWATSLRYHWCWALPKTNWQKLWGWDTGDGSSKKIYKWSQWEVKAENDFGEHCSSELHVYMNHLRIPLKTDTGAHTQSLWLSKSGMKVINLHFERPLKLLLPDLISRSINLEKSRKRLSALHPTTLSEHKYSLFPVKTTHNFWKDDILCSPLSNWSGTRGSSGVWARLLRGNNIYSFMKGMFHEDLLYAHRYVGMHCVQDTVLTSSHYESWLS